MQFVIPVKTQLKDLYKLKDLVFALDIDKYLIVF